MTTARFAASLLLCVILGSPINLASGERQQESARRILEKTGVEAGLCVHLGTTDGELEVGLTNDGRMLVHGLALEDASLEKARRTIRATGIYGLASVEKANLLNRLPGISFNPNEPDEKPSTKVERRVGFRARSAGATNQAAPMILFTR